MSTDLVKKESEEAEPWEELENRCVPIKLDRWVLGTTRSMSGESVQEIADMFGVEPRFVKAQTEILEKNKHYSALVGLIDLGKKMWKDNTYPWPEKGVRLGRKKWIPRFRKRADAIIADIDVMAKEFGKNHYPLMVEKAKDDLKGLFNPDLYPERVEDRFGLSYGFPSLDVHSYIKKTWPGLHSIHDEDISKKFKQAVEMSNSAFLTEFNVYVSKFLGMLEPDKRFMSCHLDRINEFVLWFKQMDVGGNPGFSEVVKKVDLLLDGASPAAIKQQPGLKESIKDKMEKVGEALCDMVEDKPDRAFSWED